MLPGVFPAPTLYFCYNVTTVLPLNSGAKYRPKTILNVLLAILKQGILENAIKITNEPPTGMHANLHAALDNFDQVSIYSVLCADISLLIH